MSQILSDLEFQGLVTREEIFLGKRGRPILINLTTNPAFVLEKLKGDLSVEVYTQDDENITAAAHQTRLKLNDD